MSKVIPIGMHVNTPVDHVIESAVGKLQGCVIIGYDQDGEEYFASSYADGAEVLWLIERAKKRLLDIVEEMSK